MNKKTLINIIIFIVIVAILSGAYFFFFQDEVNEQVRLISSSGRSPLDANAEIEAADISDLIVLLSGLRRISLDDSLFQDEAFRSLHDISIVIQPEPRQNTGRVNPFAPIGSEFTPPLEPISEPPTLQPLEQNPFLP